MVKHSPIGASSASRWFECPGSIALIAKAPPQESSEYAKQGTAAHWVLEECLGEDKDPWDYDGVKAPNGVELKTEDIEAVIEATDLIEQEMSDGKWILDKEVSFDLSDLYGPTKTWDDLSPQAQKFVKYCSDLGVGFQEGLKSIPESEIKLEKEDRQDLSEYFRPSLFGTADIVLRSSDGKTLKVFDYKHGKGVPVEVSYWTELGSEVLERKNKGNRQNMYYVLGALNDISKKENLPLDLYGWGGIVDSVEIGIIQPRCRHKDGPIRKYSPSPKELQDFAEELKQKAQATAKPNAPLSAGSHCGWCPALPICGQIEKRTQELAEVDFTPISSPDNLSLPEPGEMSTEKMAKILSFSNVITNWLTQVHGYALERLEMGHEIPGYKLVAKSANRKWKAENEASTFLQQTWEKEDLYEEKFISPAKAEKLLGNKHKGEIEHLWYKPEAGNTMAPEHDKRPAIAAGPGQDFERIER